MHLTKTMQRLRLTLSNRVWKPQRPLRIGWNRGYAEQPNKAKLFWDNQYHQDADPTPRRTPVYVGAGLIAIGVYYFSRRRVHAESPASTKTRRMPALFRRLRLNPSIITIHRGSSDQSRIPNDIAPQWRTSPQSSRLWGTDRLLPGYLCLLGRVLRRFAKRFGKFVLLPTSSLSRPQTTTVWGRTRPSFPVRNRSILTSISSGWVGFCRDSRRQTRMPTTRSVS